MAWLTGWNYRKKLTLDSSKIDSDCSDFPVKVIMDEDNFDFSKARSDGNDIRFTSADGETLLKHERELHQVGDTPTGYANASYETEFDGVDDYYSLPSASNLHKPYQVLEVEFTANAVNKDQNIVYLEMADRTGATGFSLVKERSVRLGITSEGKLIGYMECSNTGTFAYAYVKSSASLSADTKYSAKLVIDNNTKSFALYLDGQLQGRNTVTHAQTWSDILAYIWCDLGVLFDYHSTTSTNHSRYFDGTIHSYNLMAQNTLTSAVYHVKLPTASSTSDTEFYCYYGKADATDGADPTNVWDSNYELVMHMDSSLEDSTSNGNDGTNSGTTAGIAGDGHYRSFDGTDDYVGVPDVLGGLTNATVEVFLKHGTLTDDDDILVRGEHNINQPFVLWRDEAATDHYQFIITDAAGHTSGVQTSSAVPTTNPTVLAVVFQGDSEASMFINGTEDANSPWALSTVSDIASAAATTRIGNDSNASTKSFAGQFFEARISNSVRSDAWIKATYASLADTLLTYGSEEALTPTARPRVMVVWA